VKVFWFDKKLLTNQISEAVKRLVSERPDVKKVILFGSVAEKRATPASDVDIVIIVEDSSQRFLDRPLPFSKYFQDIGLGVELFIYTQKEIAEEDIPFVRTAFKKGEILFGDRKLYV